MHKQPLCSVDNIPVFPNKTGNECWIACLKMLCYYWGKTLVLDSVFSEDKRLGLDFRMQPDSNSLEENYRRHRIEQGILIPNKLGALGHPKFFNTQVTRTNEHIRYYNQPDFSLVDLVNEFHVVITALKLEFGLHTVLVTKIKDDIVSFNDPNYGRGHEQLGRFTRRIFKSEYTFIFHDPRDFYLGSRRIRTNV